MTMMQPTSVNIPMIIIPIWNKLVVWSNNNYLFGVGGNETITLKNMKDVQL